MASADSETSRVCRGRAWATVVWTLASSRAGGVQGPHRLYRRIITFMVCGTSHTGASQGQNLSVRLLKPTLP